MCSRSLGSSARSKLVGRRFERLDWVEETASTNSDLLSRARRGEPDGAVLVAEHQTAGRGTKGRTWQDEPSAQLMISVLVRPEDRAPAHAGRLTMAWAVATVEAVAALCPARLGIKWPNDLVDPATDRKVAGVLAESVLSARGVEAVVVGMGMNVNGGVPHELAERAVALSALAGGTVDRAALAAGLLVRFEEVLRLGGAELAEAYRRHSATIGRAVRVEWADRERSGDAVDVDDDGHLIVRFGEEQVSLASGDVVHLRPA